MKLGLCTKNLIHLVLNDVIKKVFVFLVLGDFGVKESKNCLLEAKICKILDVLKFMSLIFINTNTLITTL